MNPFTLAARQVELDKAATLRFPALEARKRRRLLPSPHAFLRGSAPLFYEILAARPELAAGPPGEGWIVGDMHLENVGAYRTDADHVVYGLNDFDDAIIGPLHLDVLRLSTSVLLAGRTFRSSGAEAIALVERVVRAYLTGVSGGAAPPLPSPIADLVSKAAGRSRRDLLDARAPLDHGLRHFARGERYLDLPPALAARIPDLVVAYITALDRRAPSHAAEWAIVDAAQRVAGNGSLGSTRIAVLVRDGSDHERLLELKEGRPPGARALFPEPQGLWSHHAERSAKGARALADAPPRHLAAFKAGDLSFAGRRLFPQEDKLDLDALQVGPKLEGVVESIGHLLGKAHARGRTAPAPPWSPADVARVIDHAIELAGILEAAYLAYARRAGTLAL